MSETALTAGAPAANRVTWRWLALIGGGALVTVGLSLWAPSPAYAFVPALLLIAGALTGWMLLHPLRQLVLVMGGSVFVLGYSPGVQAFEVIYAVALAGYLACWYGARLWVYRASLAPTAGDKAMLIFLIGGALSLVMTLVYRGDPLDYLNGAAAFAMAAFYFPVREAFARYRWGPAVVVGLLLWITLFVALRNVVNYRQALAAQVIAELAGMRRVSANEMVLLVGSAFCLGLLPLVRGRRYVLGLLAALAVLLPAVVVTQYRGLWLAVLVAIFMAFVLGGTRIRLPLLLWGGVLLVVGGGLFYLVAGDSMGVILKALAYRFSTIQGSATRDISLLGRVYEARTVLEHVAQNPILGHGMGVPYSKYDIITQQIWTSTWIHNGYIGLLYTFGLWGFASVIVAWMGAIRRGIIAYRTGPPNALATMVGLGGTLALCGMLVLTITANPFHNADGFLCFGMMGGLASGAHARLMGDACS